MSSEDRLLDMERRRDHSVRRLELRRRSLAVVERRLAAHAEVLAEDLDEAKRLQEQYDEQLVSIRSELRVLKDVTIPGLVAANKLLLAQWDAETAIQVRRQVAALPGQGEV